MLQNVYAQELPPFELHNGDRVVFVGDSFFENAQRHGYIEAALTNLWPDRFYTFRNLGWTGDTVFGEARDHYTNPPTAYEHLIEQVETTSPTVLFLSYGSNMAFEDEPAFERFREGYHTLLDDLDFKDKRCVLLAPLPHEQKASPHPDVSAFNANLEQASQIIAEIAESRRCYFIDLHTRFRSLFSYDRPALTSNGIHLNEEGYLIASAAVLQSVVREFPIDSLVIDITSETDQPKFEKRGDRYVFEVELNPALYNAQRILSIRGLKKGKYTLFHGSGGEIITTEHDTWGRAGALVTFEEDNERAEQLREEIIEKNTLYFRKYRPQNETYLVGFRKYEQGQNAVELELLDPLIGEKENSIGRLKNPVTLTFTLERL